MIKKNKEPMTKKSNEPITKKTMEPMIRSGNSRPRETGISDPEGQ